MHKFIQSTHLARAAMLLLVALLTSSSAWADQTSVTLSGNATDGYYYNMEYCSSSDDPSTYKVLNVPDGVTTFKVYDDGGKTGYHSVSEAGYYLLAIAAPEGKRIKLTGNIASDEYRTTFKVFSGKVLSSGNIGEDTQLLSTPGGTNDNPIDIGTILSTNRYLVVSFRVSSTSANAYRNGLDLTVDVVNTTGYTIGVNQGSNGTMTAPDPVPAAFETAVMTSTPATGYMLAAATAEDQYGHSIEVSGGWYTSNQVSFTMPAANTTVTPVFTNAKTAAGGLFINMLSSGTLEGTIPDDVTSFHVYDDGGKESNLSSMKYSYLLLTAKTGCVFRLTGTIKQCWFLSVYDDNSNTDNSKKLLQTSNTKDNAVDIGTISTTGNQLYIVFEGNTTSNIYDRLDLTVTVVDPSAKNDVEITTVDHGTITSDKASASINETVTLTATPATGYVLNGITVKDESNVTIPTSLATWYGPNTITFTMPDTKVTITPEWVPVTYDHLTVSLPESGTQEVNIPSGVSSFKIEDSNSSTSAVGLSCNMPDGYTLQLAGSFKKGSYGGGSLKIYDGLTTDYSLYNADVNTDGSATDIGTITSNFESVQIQTGLYTDINLTATLVQVPTGQQVTVAANTWRMVEGNTYTVSSDVTVSNRIVIDGSVTLTLGEGATLTAEKGISVKGGNALTLEGTGALVATQNGQVSNNNHYAAIGGDYQTTTGTITINSGIITATSTSGGAALGSGRAGTGGIINIHGGTVTATATSGGAAIGGGSTASDYQVKITGGTVNAENTDAATAIGDGYTEETADLNGSVYISGGTVNATASNTGIMYYHAAIGGTYISEGPSITITGGQVTAWHNYTGTSTSATGLVAIGAGRGGTATKPMTISLTNVEDFVYAKSGIYKVTKIIVGASSQELKQEADGGTTYGANDEISGDALTALANQKLMVYTGNWNTVTFQDGETVLSTQKIVPGGTATRPEDPVKKGYSFEGWINGSTSYDFATVVSSNITLTPAWTALSDFTYLGTDGKSTTAQGKSYVCTYANMTKMDSNDSPLWVANSNIQVSKRITVSGDITMILADGITMEALKGITVPDGSSFTILAQSAGTGKLYAGLDKDEKASAEDYHAGIGGQNKGSLGTINIYNGTIIARGGHFSAAIGGAGQVENNDGIINIHGGNITAYGGNQAASIGGGYGHSVNQINITGGTVSTNSNYVSLWGAGIGGGDGSGAGTIVISGGTVNCNSSKGAGIGTGYAYYGTSPGSITITGGTITGSCSFADIGAGKAAKCPDITITGGTINVSKIGEDVNDSETIKSSKAKIKISGGQVTANFLGFSATNYTGAAPTTDNMTVELDWTDAENDWLKLKNCTGSIVTLKKPFMVKDSDPKTLVTTDWLTALNNTEQTIVPFLLTVSFDANGGSGTYETQKVTYNTAATTPANNPTRSGWEFKGWYNGNTLYDFSTQVTSDLTLTAKWIYILNETDGITSQINSEITDEEVKFTRSFTANRASTVILPFNYAYNADTEGNFYTFNGIDKTTTPWKVIMQSPVSGTLTAHTPYLFMPKATGNITFTGTAVNMNDYSKYAIVDDWCFTGMYENKEWNEGASELGRVYGFAANAQNDEDDSKDVSPGDFIKVNAGASIAPFRAYLVREQAVTPAPQYRAAAYLPNKLRVVLVDAFGQTTELSETISVAHDDWSDAVWYTLDGRKLQGKPAKKGLYIVNGNVVAIK